VVSVGEREMTVFYPGMVYLLRVYRIGVGHWILEQRGMNRMDNSDGRGGNVSVE
jgi:hypothetical protein